jgi:UDP-N-acetylglucosamine acyltransferase
MKAIEVNTMIHPTALIGSEVLCEEGVTIGPYSVIDGNVTLGRDSVVKSHVVISAQDGCLISIGAGTVVHAFVEMSGNIAMGEECILHSHSTFGGNLTIGDRNVFGAHNSVGHVNQDKKHVGGPLFTEVGNDNRFFENVVVHCGTSDDLQLTKIGNQCHIMDGAHIAHDMVIGNNVIVGNDVNFGGHVVVQDWVIVSAGTGIHQFCHIGEHAMIAGYTRVVHDVAPYTMFLDKPAGINVTGLKRRDFERKEIVALNRAFVRLFTTDVGGSQTFAERLAELRMETDSKCVAHLVEFVAESQNNSGRRNCYTTLRD